METNEMTKEREPLAVMTIPSAIFTQMFFDVQCLASMHKNLIRMYEMESALKKHHKAYLHIREMADEICSWDKRRVAQIQDHYVNPDRYLDEAVRFYEALNQEERTPDHMEQTKEEPAEDPIQGKDMVMMSVGTLGVMQDDMLSLAAVIEHMVQMFVSIGEGADYNRGAAVELAGEASALSQEVFKRWEDLGIAEPC